MLSRSRGAISLVLCASLLASAPGPAAWAAMVREMPAAPEGAVVPQSPVLPVALPALGEQVLPSIETAALPQAAALPTLSATIEAAKPAQAAAAMPVARAAAMTATRALARPEASESSLSASAGAAFDVVKPSLDAASDEPVVGFVGGETVVRGAELSQRDGVIHSTAYVGGNVDKPARRSILSRAVAAASAQPIYVKIAAVAAMAALTIAFPKVLSAVTVPLIMATCNSMRERAIKDATILPQQQTQQEIAKKELDALLVNFGKKVKEAAEADARVTSSVSAHSAEHAMEEPILELLPELKAKWASGEKLTKEEALKMIRDAVVARLKTRFPNETDQVIEDILRATGGWDEFLNWEKRHEILDNLKKAAEEKPEETKAELKKIMVGSGGHSHGGHSHGHGGAALGVAFLVGLGLAHLAFGVPGAAVAGLAFMAATVGGDSVPPQPSIDLDTYLAALKLTKEEIDFLKEYTMDIGARDMAPIIGRSKELRRAITILSKPAGTQNNPMVLGDKGVGKTAIVESIARYLYQNRLPSLKGKRILELDSGKLTAGTGLQGEMEKRLTTLRKILAKTDNKVILFVDEIHSILKNVATSNSVPDLLKSPLRNGEMTVIGATTMGEYRKYVEQDPAFADRFDTIQVNEPTEDEAIEMLEGDLEYLERKFDVQIEPEAAKAAVKLSTRYIPEKFLPRKARQLLESAIADAKPEAARDGLQVQIDQLTDRLRIMVKRYAALKAQGDAAAKPDVVMAYNRVVGLYQTILSLEDQRGSIVKETITKEHVMRSLAKETGIPVGEMGEDEYKRLMRMEPWFKERIVGQDDAIKALADTVRTNKAGLSDPNRPQGVFMFAGKTGVGKTALTRSLADFLFSDPEAVIRLDMSEYMEKFAVQRLFGAPPGYVGYESGGELTEKVRRRPYSVVLLDEIEKAHPDVLNALLQVFDAGRMTDGKQNTVNFKNTIIIMTTNLGSASEAEGDAFKSDVMETIRQRLRPEFVNRVDKIVVFNPIDVQQAESITKIMVKDVEKRLREQDLDLRVTPEAVAYLAKKGFDPRYGARPLKRVVENDITNALSPFLLQKKSEGALAHGGIVEVGVQDDKIAFDLKPNPPPSVELTPLPDGPLGDKLRRILEQAAAGEGIAGDIATFEGALFPDRKAVTLDKPLGAFRAEEPPFQIPQDAKVEAFSNATPGTKDANLTIIKAGLGDRWASPAHREALNAWVDAFAKTAKELSPRQLPVARYAASKDGDFAITISALADAGYAAKQQLSRKALEHFAQALPDEAAVRARAGALKDEGRAVDLDWLEAKRLVEAIPGASFGWTSDEANGGSWRFWLKLPAAVKIAAQAPAETAAGDKKSADLVVTPELDAPVAAMEARLTPAKMFLFLTQRAPASMAARRALVAGMLDSKSTQLRLIGLHMAASLLSAAAWREVASTVRMLRLSDLKDYALFSELAARHPEVPMTAQRQALVDSYESALRAMRGNVDREGYYMDSSARAARRYASLAKPVLPDADSKVSESDAREARTYRARFRKVGLIFAASTIPVVAAIAFGAHHYLWPLAWQIIVPAAVSGISLWIYLGNFLSVRRNGPRDSAYYEAAVMRRLTPAEQLNAARRWLDGAIRGQAPYFNTAEEAALLGPLLDQMPKDEKVRIFKRWRQELEKGLEKTQKKPGSTSPKIFATLGLLARLLTRIPSEERDACAKALMMPLRGRWLPSGSDDYLAGLGAWLAEAPLSPEELEELLGVVINFPTSNQARLASFMPIFKGIARRGSLTITARASLDQAFAGLAAEASSRREYLEMVELARIRVKLRSAVDVWGGLQELFEGNNISNLTWQTFRALDQLASEAAPSEAEGARLIQRLKAYGATANRGQQDKAYEEILQARLSGSREARLEAVLSALRDVAVSDDPNQPVLERELLDEASKLIDAPMKGTEDNNAWIDAVRENLSRLQAEK